MESITVKNLSFAYPNRTENALADIGFSVNSGEFILVCGKSGCGKTTLLRLLKPPLSPFGTVRGTICFNGEPLSSYSAKQQVAGIGFVMQNPDNQLVTDKVWHELAFGLESLGCETSEIRTRVSEMASFFGMQTWFYKNVAELSGGQKQLLNLASVMVMQPSVIILDEPTSQLDPIAAQEFLQMLVKINRELGTTVIVSEHRLEDVFPVADRVIVMDYGTILADDTPKAVGKALKNSNHDMYQALPVPLQVYGAVENSLACPLTVREGRHWLEDYAKEHLLQPDLIPKDKAHDDKKEVIVAVKDAWFRYERNLPDVVKGLELSVFKGELFCILGGNGSGKTTALSLISGIHTPYRGNVFIKGIKISDIKNLYGGLLGVLPQNPQSVFAQKTVYLDLLNVLSEKKLSDVEKTEQIQKVAAACRIETVLNRHPYDLSGGEQQRAALAKVLISKPEILLLDEPTKGMDAHFKKEFAEILVELKQHGVTILMVSHDIEFCAEYADRCALVFDGNITSVGTPRQFFKDKNFYTTTANRMARMSLSDAVLTEDIILACGGSIQTNNKQKRQITTCISSEERQIESQKSKKMKPARIVIGSFFALLFILSSLSIVVDFGFMHFRVESPVGMAVFYGAMLLELFIALLCFFPDKPISTEVIHPLKSKRKLTKRARLSLVIVLLCIPLTICAGVCLLGTRKYYITSLLVIAQTMIAFYLAFETRKPKAREIVTISVLCALAVAGRAMFFSLPQFKPVVAIVIIAGVCFGGETGFLVGSITGFVSNFFFGQGPWTPWQMFAFGIIGFLAGVLFQKGILRKSKVSLCLFGFLATLVVYGGIMNPASVIMWQRKISWDMIMTACAMGLPFDSIHALSNALFLWFISVPMIDKLERVKIKYGFIVR